MKQRLVASSSAPLTSQPARRCPSLGVRPRREEYLALHVAASAAGSRHARRRRSRFPSEILVFWPGSYCGRHVQHVMPYERLWPKHWVLTVSGIPGPKYQCQGACRRSDPARERIPLHPHLLCRTNHCDGTTEGDPGQEHLLRAAHFDARFPRQRWYCNVKLNCPDRNELSRQE